MADSVLGTGRIARPSVSIEAIGRERQPLATIENFVPDPDALRAAAIGATFGPAGEHYPGVRAPLPPDYLRNRLPFLATVIGRAFGRCRRIRVVDASFSIVSTPPERLTLKQRLPHVDAFGAERIALIHYLAPASTQGTAFFRHRATGFETVDDSRAPAFFERLRAETAERPPAGYIDGDTDLFERIKVADARYNRALLYRSFVLHSGAIDPVLPLPADPAEGRLTVTAFLALE